jgi:cytochrome c oxidase accessory protein FixG
VIEQERMNDPLGGQAIARDLEGKGRTAAGPAKEVEQALYAVRKKIYPRTVHGRFDRWRWGLVWLTQLVFYGLPWLGWNDRQAVLFDLAARKFYIFGFVFWPQDFIYLTALLIIAALTLFLVTAVGGRLWCGYACPQTVYTEIFMWIERKIEGGRAQRMLLDEAPMSARKLAIKAAKHGAWIAVALWTGFTFVGYFMPITALLGEVASLATGPWETFWILFYGFATYGNAGWMREQVCKYMCPYARFQSAMFDRDTMIVTYDAARGEPRGPRSRKIARGAAALGDCVNCGLCVQVCPTGIDIRDGLQYECIGCAACIDACDQVMGKFNYPAGLIRYSTENALAQGWSFHQMVRRVLRTRTLIYGAILFGVMAVLAGALYLRVPLKVDIVRDRASLAREVEGGRIEKRVSHPADEHPGDAAQVPDRRKRAAGNRHRERIRGRGSSGHHPSGAAAGADRPRGARQGLAPVRVGSQGGRRRADRRARAGGFPSPLT